MKRTDEYRDKFLFTPWHTTRVRKINIISPFFGINIPREWARVWRIWHPLDTARVAKLLLARVSETVALNGILLIFFSIAHATEATPRRNRRGRSSFSLWTLCEIRNFLTKQSSVYDRMRWQRCEPWTFSFFFFISLSSISERREKKDASRIERERGEGGEKGGRETAQQRGKEKAALRIHAFVIISLPFTLRGKMEERSVHAILSIEHWVKC